MTTTNPLQALLDEGIVFHKAGDFPNAALRYNQVLNFEPENGGVLFLLGDIAVRQGCNGLAINLLRNSVQFEANARAYVALGVAYRNENMYDQACAAWDVSNSIEPSIEAYNNLASCYSDHSQPEKALGYIRKAEALGGTDAPNVRWNRALANLSCGNWPQAWEDHEMRFCAEVQSVSTRRHHDCPVWDGTPGKRLAIHGEQGVGDEIMFLSMVEDVLHVCPDAAIEVEPRLMDLVERSFGIPVYGNEKAMAAHEKPFDAMVAIGSLGQFFRQQDSEFPGVPYLQPDPERVDHWRRQFAMQGPRPYIGIAWQGGAKETRIFQRSIHPREFKFCKRGTVIALQYGPEAPQEAAENGYLYYSEFNGGANLDEMAAMVAACDVVVTVAQTLVHMAGAVGTPAHVLVPKHSSWRYGMTDRMVWYRDAVLHRQTKDGDWGHPLAEAKKQIDAICREFQNADI